MAEERAGIKKLISLRRQRPSFSRMISWEMSQAAEQEPVKKTKQRKKKAGADDTQEAVEVSQETEDKSLDENDGDIEVESADSSEYETACEDEDDIVAQAEHLTSIDSESQFGSIDCDILELDDVDNDGEDDGEDDDDPFLSSIGSEKNSVQTADEVQSGRRRRLSKKQKRKRKKYFRMTYVDDLYNLGNLFDVTDEINDVFAEVLATEPNVDVKRRVPTLVELCMRANRRQKRTNSERQRNVSGADKVKNVPAQVEIPYGMKKLLASWGRNQSQVEKQLSFLLNKVLPIVEENVSSRYYLYADVRDDKKQDIIFQKRSIWSDLPYPPTKELLSNVQYASEKSSAFLFMPSMHYNKDIDNAYYRYCDHYSHDNVILTTVMWAFATTIDLMLPSQTSTTAFIRVKRALNLRYKNLVDTMFENVLPYVMWARGKVAIATDMFKNLVEKETRADTKAMYLSEIGRMHAMFGDATTAEQFYRIATETASEDLNEERRDRCIDELTEQKQVLLASIYDTGVMDKGKSIQSFSYWSGVRSLPNVRNASIIAGADAFLCYHLSNCSDSNPYEEAISKLEKMTKPCNYMYYYQSMIYALQGLADKSTQSYRESRSSCFHTPGDTVLTLLGRKAKNPWQPVLDLVHVQKSAVKPFKVIWRTNLQPPRVTKQRPTEAQVNSPKLNLRLNEAGHVTGDMQMALPPLRDISLDRFTGSLVIDNIPAHTATWMSSVLPSDLAFYRDLLVPTPMLIYSGEDGTTVHMVKPSNTASGARQVPYFASNGPPCPFMLYWRGPDGQTAKLKLLPAYRSQVKKELIETFEKKEKYYCHTMKYTEASYKMLFKFVDVAYEKCHLLDEGQISAAVMNYNRHIKQVEKKKGKGEKIPKSVSKKTFHSHFNYQKNNMYEKCELAEEPFVFGKSIALLVTGNPDQSNNRMLFIVNTEDKAAFLSFELHSDLKGFKILEQGRNNYTSEEYMMCLKGREFLVLNQLGEIILSTENKTIISEAQNGNPPVVIYPNIYGVNAAKNSIWRSIISIEEVIDDVEDELCWSIGSVYDELAQGTSIEPSLVKMTHVGESTDSTGKLLMVNFVAGLGFIDPATMEFVPVKVEEGCAQHFEFTTGNRVMKGDFENVQILAEKTFEQNNKPVCRIAFGVGNKVFLLDLARSDGQTMEINMICSLQLPGLVKELCLVGKNVGMLISLTQHYGGEEYYREHVFYFDFNGYLHGVLLCLNKGPRSFCPVYLHGNEESGEGTVPAGWYVYLRDGWDGIMCVRLQ